MNFFANCNKLETKHNCTLFIIKTQKIAMGKLPQPGKENLQKAYS